MARFSFRKARKQVADALPHETVTDEYGTRLRNRPEVEAIMARSPADAKRLHPGEPKWQIQLAPKYITNRLALARFLALVRESHAGQAYLYFPIGEDAPVIWFRDSRYTLAEFQEKFGQ